MKSIMSTPMSQQQSYQQIPQQQTYQQPQQNDVNDPVSQAIALAQSGANLENEFKTIVKQNPDKAQAFAQFMQQNKGRNPWDIAYELMAQRGINPAKYGLPPRR